MRDRERVDDRPVDAFPTALRYSGVVPCTLVNQLLLPYTIWPEPRTAGATAATDAHSVAIARASSEVRVGEAPLPSRIPLLVMLPDSTMMTLLPILAICS